MVVPSMKTMRKASGKIMMRMRMIPIMWKKPKTKMKTSPIPTQKTKQRRGKKKRKRKKISSLKTKRPQKRVRRLTEFIRKLQ